MPSMEFGQGNDGKVKGVVESNVMELGLALPRGSRQAQQPLSIFVRAHDGVSLYAIDIKSPIVQRCAAMYPESAPINYCARRSSFPQADYETLVDFLVREHIPYTVVQAPSF